MKVVIADSFTDSLEYLGSRRYKIREFFHNVKNRIFKPYTTIKPRYVDHNWRDKDSLLVHFSFELLLRYLEDEVPQQEQYYDVNSENEMDREISERWTEIINRLRALADWYENEYLPYEDYSNQMLLHDLQPEPLSCFLETEFGMEYRPTFENEDDEMLYHGVSCAVQEYEAEMERELTEKMKELVDLRYYLWS